MLIKLMKGTITTLMSDTAEKHFICDIWWKYSSAYANKKLIQRAYVVICLYISQFFESGITSWLWQSDRFGY